MTTQKAKQKSADIVDKEAEQKSADIVDKEAEQKSADIVDGEAEQKAVNEEKVEIYLSKTVQLLPGAEPLKPGSHSLIESAANELIESGLAVSKETAKSEAEE